MKTRIQKTFKNRFLFSILLLFITAGVYSQGTLQVSGNGNVIARGSTSPSLSNDTDFGNVEIQSNKSNSFSLVNTVNGGNPSKRLNNIIISISGSTDFSPSNTNLGDLKGSDSPISHLITFSPSSLGVKTATVTISFSNGTNSPYTFTIKGTGISALPEINLTGNSNTILTGDSTPSTTDGTSFGTIDTGTTLSRQFTIQNTGSPSTNLLISNSGSGISISGGSGYFVVTSQPAQNSIITGGNSLNFTVEYRPLLDGVHTATISISNNDSNENPYTFSIQGTSITAFPEIDVKGNGASIANGDVYPSTFNNTNFGSVNIGSTSTKVYNIYNTGTGALNISNITLSNTTDFQIVGTPFSSPVSAGGNTSFSIRYTGSSGKHSATVTINNNDSDEGTYSFVIRGSSKATGDTGLWTVTNVTPNLTLNNPYDISFFPDGNLWITERVGKKIVRVNSVGTGNAKTTMIDLSSSVYQTGGQDGLMGLAIHPSLLANPNTTTNNYVYVAYTFSSNGADSGRKLRIARLIYNNTSKTLAVDTSLDANGKILEIPHASNDHNSGRLIVGPDSKLYYTIGDQGANQFANACNPIEAQSLPTSASDYSVYKGKILRINLDGTVPADNPTLNGVKSHVFTYGHRNPQGIIFGANGKLYSSEHGAKVDDELNIISAGKNYGWPHIAGYYDNLAYGYCNWSSTPGGCSSGGFTDHNCPSGVASVYEFNPINASILSNFQPPIGTYDSTTNYDPSGDWLTWPTVAPSSIDIYEAGLIPNWGQSLLVTTLKEGTIFRAKLNTLGDALVDITTNNKFEEFHSSNDRYRDLAMDPDGLTFYAITDSQGTTSGPSGSSSVTLANPGVVMKFKYIGAPSNPNTTYYVDADGDSFGDINDITGTVFPSNPGAGYSINNTDCNDSNASINPNTVWYIGVDNDNDTFIGTITSVTQCTSPGAGYSTTAPATPDCNDNNAAINPNTEWYLDADNDNFAVSKTTSCTSPGVGYKLTVLPLTDCNDSNAAINPNTVWYVGVDADNDSFFGSTTSVTQCASPGAGYATTPPATPDCNDSNASINPNTQWYLDADNDGFAISKTSSCSSPGVGYTLTVLPLTDCNDSNAAVNPNTEWYLDADNDNFAVSKTTSCTSPGAGYKLTVLPLTDCNDSNAAINPNTVWYIGVDADGDTYFGSTSSITQCTTPGAGYSTTPPATPDCNDNNFNVNPGATEITGNGIDDDCNPATPDSVPTCLDIMFDSFENGFGNWNNGGKDCNLSNSFAKTGIYSIQLRNSGTGASFYSNNINLSGRTQIAVNFTFYSSNLNANEGFYLEISTNGGSNYSIYKTWANGINFENNISYDISTLITGITLTTNTRFRFRCNSSNRGDLVYFDDVKITECIQGATAKIASGSKTSVLSIEKDVLNTNSIKIFPNPASHELFIKREGFDSISNIKLYTITGQLVRHDEMKSESFKLDLNGLSEGLYLLRISKQNGELIKNEHIIIKAK